jgi:UDP-glucose 4-epimerase
MNVLLTGGAGYIGAHTCVDLLASGHDIVVADDFSNSSEQALRRIKALTGKDFPYYNVNVCDKPALRRAFSEQKIDAAIHFAAFKAVGESVQKPMAYYRNNLDASMTLFELMDEFGVKKILFSSSATVYGKTGAVEYIEDMPIGTPSSPYGQTKCMVEQMLKDISAAKADWSVVLLRYFNPVGAHESGEIGEDPSGVPNNLMPRVLQFATGRLPALGVFGDDYPTRDGTCVRDYIHVQDLARGHRLALEYMARMTGCEPINLGMGRGYSVLDVIHTFECVNGVKIDYDIAPRRAGDLPEYYANARKAKELLGWTAEKTLEDMCRDAWRFQQKNPRGYRG